MDNTSLRDIDKRVAEALGSRWIRTWKERIGGEKVFFHASFKNPSTLPDCVKWEPWTGTEEDAFADALKAGRDPYRDVYRYSTFPAADLVRLEIDRRGWQYAIGSEQGDDLAGMYWSWVRADKTKPYDYHSEIADSPHVALCLAFLAACEATKEEAQNE